MFRLLSSCGACVLSLVLFATLAVCSDLPQLKSGVYADTFAYHGYSSNAFGAIELKASGEYTLYRSAQHVTALDEFEHGVYAIEQNARVSAYPDHLVLKLSRRGWPPTHAPRVSSYPVHVFASGSFQMRFAAGSSGADTAAEGVFVHQVGEQPGYYEPTADFAIIDAASTVHTRGAFTVGFAAAPISANSTARAPCAVPVTRPVNSGAPTAIGSGAAQLIVEITGSFASRAEEDSRQFAAGALYRSLALRSDGTVQATDVNGFVNRGRWAVAVVSDSVAQLLLLLIENEDGAEYQEEYELTVISADQFALASNPHSTNFYRVSTPPVVAKFSAQPLKSASTTKPINGGAAAKIIRQITGLFTSRAEEDSRFDGEAIYRTLELGSNGHVKATDVSGFVSEGQWTVAVSNKRIAQLVLLIQDKDDKQYPEVYALHVVSTDQFSLSSIPVETNFYRVTDA